MNMSARAARQDSPVSIVSILALALPSGAVFMLATLGLVRPLRDLWVWRYMIANLELVGEVDLAAVRYKPGAEAAVGEALTDFVGTGFELGF